MMKKKFVITLLATFGLFFSNCELDSRENFHFIALPITDAEIPDFFVFNQSNGFEVTFLRPDSCTYFQGFDVFEDDNGLTTIVAIGSVLTQEENCNSTEELLSDTVTITARDVEFYTLRFYTGEDAEGNPIYDEHQVPVVNDSNQ